MTTNFQIRSSLDLKLNRYKRAIVSIPALYGDRTNIEAKDLISSGPVSTVGKFTTEQHLAHLLSTGRLDDSSPLLVLGIRNTLVNYRCVVQLGGKCHSIIPETPMDSARPYYGLAIDSAGQITCETRHWTPNQELSEDEEFISGVPASWEGLDEAALDDAILVETADHSHLFHLPRGKHPDATDASRDRWQQLQKVFMDVLHADTKKAARAMRDAIEAGYPLKEEGAYLHQALAVDANGALYCRIEQNSIKSIGKTLASWGFTRAICVENSGSIQPTFYPMGASGIGIPLLRAANFRPEGRALLVIELEESRFDLF